MSGRLARSALLPATLLAVLALAPAAAADLADETALAERHAPVIRLVEQVEECGHGEPYRPTDVDLSGDIHDRVNYAVEQSFLRVDSDARTVSLELTIDTKISQVMEYFEIFLGRMQLCRHAAELLDARFRLVINGAELA